MMFFLLVLLVVGYYHYEKACGRYRTSLMVLMVGTAVVAGVNMFLP